MPEYEADEVQAATQRATDARYALLESRGALAKRPSFVVSARAANPTLGKAARRQEEDAATTFVRHRTTAASVLGEVAPIRGELDAELAQKTAAVQEIDDNPETIAYEAAHEELGRQKKALFGQVWGKDLSDPQVAAAKVQYDEVKARYDQEAQAHQSVSTRRGNLEARKEELAHLIRKLTMAVANLADEVARAQSPTFDGWSLDPDTPEVRAELASAISVGEKGAAADVASEQRATQQATQQLQSGAGDGGGGRSGKAIAGLGLAGAAVGALGVGALGAGVGYIAGAFLGSSAIGAAVGAGAGALLGGLLGGGIGLGVGLFGRKGDRGGGTTGGAAGGEQAAAPDNAAEAHAQDEQQEQQVQAAGEQQAAATGSGEPGGLEDSDEQPRSKLAGPRGGATPRGPRRGITWAENKENPETVATKVKDFDADDWEREPRNDWKDESGDPFTGGYGVYPKGQPRKSKFFENDSRGGREQVKEQKELAPSAFGLDPETTADADEWA